MNDESCNKSECKAILEEKANHLLNKQQQLKIKDLAYNSAKLKFEERKIELEQRLTDYNKEYQDYEFNYQEIISKANSDFTKLLDPNNEAIFKSVKLPLKLMINLQKMKDTIKCKLDELNANEELIASKEKLLDHEISQLSFEDKLAFNNLTKEKSIETVLDNTNKFEYLNFGIIFLYVF